MCATQRWWHNCTTRATSLGNRLRHSIGTCHTSRQWPDQICDERIFSDIKLGHISLSSRGTFHGMVNCFSSLLTAQIHFTTLVRAFCGWRSWDLKPASFWLMDNLLLPPLLQPPNLEPTKRVASQPGVLVHLIPAGGCPVRLIDNPAISLPDPICPSVMEGRQEGCEDRRLDEKETKETKPSRLQSFPAV